MLSLADWDVKEVYESVDIIRVGGMRVSGLQATRASNTPDCRRDGRRHERLVLAPGGCGGSGIERYRVPVRRDPERPARDRFRSYPERWT